MTLEVPCMTGLDIKIARLRLGYKQYKFAQRIKLHPSILSLIESEKRPAKPTELARILDALGLRASEEVRHERDH
jgi:transcriptional regulator with XRE-family HTH domain